MVGYQKNRKDGGAGNRINRENVPVSKHAVPENEVGDTMSFQEGTALGEDESVFRFTQLPNT